MVGYNKCNVAVVIVFDLINKRFWWITPEAFGSLYNFITYKMKYGERIDHVFVADF